MSFQLFGGSRTVLPSGWQNERFFTVFGGTEVVVADPGADATLTATAIIGSIRISVPTGSHITLRGSTLLGGRENNATGGTGSLITVNASTVLGSVQVVEGN